MAYRQIHEHPVAQKREMRVETSRAHFLVTNGTITELAIPCYYTEMIPIKEGRWHCPDWEHYMGWPTPQHPDHSAHGMGHLHPEIDTHAVCPIHLTEEGYESVDVVLSEIAPSGFEVNAWIDEKYDWIVRLHIHALMTSAYTNEVTIPASIFLNGHFEDREVVDLLQHVMFGIMPAIIQE